ncbi:phage tail protein [Salmonella enterica subsp. enterica serovar Oranienburg]|uniref:Phage tail protein n=5 Tax=Salmonella enterica TaxID=28901 RepID=A0A5Z3SZ34_SALER|nr:phage tail protein [Salmonella enterica]EAA5259551.1 phage tail protein [Salmonella enterica subsp. enterica serovar Virchow]EAA5885822.1 phage tail protein [Salmonella enterica subsp. enterica serovar Oslo]EBZ1189287.1 phage tail protein [Salmonella enterica subsp. enterica serovar Sandiego]EBZ5874976.1 phage tail protein [Salmonella enterica subsp. enterica serovar Millesi]ECS7989134.1 phage tail protein [Salmonella enterica subsp. enterica serovar Poona]EDT7189867.1 phage tail protein [
MSAKFYTLLTDIGAAKLASATALGIPLKITHMAVGDGGGVLPTPSAQQTALVAERRRAALNMLYIDPQNNSQIIAEQVIPETEGGWWIREVGLFDETGALIAVGNCPESYKPQLTEGSGRTQTVRMVLITSSTDNITLKIDPAVVLATRKYVDDKALELKVYVDDLMAKHLAAPDPHSQYAQKDSPTLTGIPKVPTPAAGNSTKQIANTEFVASSIAAIVDSAPAALDTLNELAAALGNDPNFATTMINALAGKQPLDNTLTNLSGKDIAGLLTYLGLGETINLAKNAVPATRRVNSKPLTGDITLWASDVGAISADAVGEITDNGTMASANTPGWWRVEVSNSDTVADFPTYPDGSKLYSYGYLFVEKIGEVWFQHYYAHMGANAKRQDWGTVPNTSRPWIVDYNTANKPTANDVQALPIAGGRLNGPLSIGTDNALGGNSIVLGDNDTGFKQNGDGVLDVYSNYTHVLRFIGNLVESMVSLKVNGNAVATGEVQAGNGTSRMAGNGDIFGNVWNGWLSTHLNNNLVADVQLGAGTSVATWNNAGSWPNTPGYVVTSVWKDNQGENIDGIAYAPLQKRLGIQWYTVQGGTA